MLLSELKKFLKEKHFTTLSQLTQHFETDADLMRDMLAHYIEKGQVRLLICANSENRACGSCQLCDQNMLETYEWVEDI